MVGQISVFPDVGAAFFGSYRGARNQRLQESAMRAEMAAAQAERQRQSQAREAFARLQGPDQRIEQVQLDPFQRATNRIGGALDEAGIGGPRIGYDEQRITPGLTPEQRSFEEQRLAQADPNSFMAYRQTRQGPEARDYSGILEALPQQLEGAQSEEEAQRVVTRAWNVARGYGYQGSPQDLLSEAQALYVPEGPEQTNRYRQAVEAGLQPGTQPFQDYMLQQGQFASSAPSTNITIPGQVVDLDRRTGAQLGGEEAGYRPDATYEQRLARVGGQTVRSWEEVDGGDAGAPTPSVGGDMFDAAVERVAGGEAVGGVVSDLVRLSQERAAAGQGEAISPELAEYEIRARQIPEAERNPQAARVIAQQNFANNQTAARQMRAAGLAQEVIDEYGNLASGLGSNLSFIRGLPADQVEVYLRSITSPMIINQLTAMREYAQSIGERGSGFGQLTQNEIAIIQAAQSLLDARLPPEQLRSELERTIRELSDVRAEREYVMQQDMPDVYAEYIRRQERYDSRLGGSNTYEPF